MNEHESSSVDVAIIGGGIAGLYSAFLLMQNSSTRSFVILEASSKLGGRIQANETLLSGIKIDLGASFIHGSDNNIVVDIARQQGWAMRELQWPNYVYFGTRPGINERQGRLGQLLSPSQVVSDDAFTAMIRAWASLSEIDPSTCEDISVMTWLLEHGLPNSMCSLADSIYANDYGVSSLHDCGLREVVLEQNSWTYGDDYLLLEGGFSRLVDFFVSSLPSSRIKTNWRVKQVNWSDERSVILVSSCGKKTVHATRVIVTAPVAVLRDGDISFNKPLPFSYQRALRNVGCCQASKIIAVFSSAFWPSDLFDIVCDGCFFPEIWMTMSSSEISIVGGKVYCVGFLAGKRSEDAAFMTDDHLVNILLQLLDAMFCSGEDPYPATSRLIGSCVKHWQHEPFIKMAYCAPVKGSVGTRQILSTPLSTRGIGSNCNKIFFCGEGSHLGFNPCVNGAMETASSIVNSLLMDETTKSRL